MSVTVNTVKLSKFEYRGKLSLQGERAPRQVQNALIKSSSNYDLSEIMNSTASNSSDSAEI